MTPAASGNLKAVSKPALKNPLRTATMALLAPSPDAITAGGGRSLGRSDHQPQLSGLKAT